MLSTEVPFYSMYRNREHPRAQAQSRRETTAIAAWFRAGQKEGRGNPRVAIGRCRPPQAESLPSRTQTRLHVTTADDLLEDAYAICLPTCAESSALLQVSPPSHVSHLQPEDAPTLSSPSIRPSNPFTLLHPPNFSLGGLGELL